MASTSLLRCCDLRSLATSPPQTLEAEMCYECADERCNVGIRRKAHHMFTLCERPLPLAVSPALDGFAFAHVV